MKASILQENLQKGLNLTSRAINSRVNLPILGNILISTKEAKIKLTATNLEISINVFLPAKKERSGQFTIPAKDITEFVSSLPTGRVDLEEKKEKLELVSGSYRAIFNGMSAAEFPQVPSLVDGKKEDVLKKTKIDTKSFIKAVNYVNFAAAQDENRPVLTGVRLSFEESNLQLVATDGYRLSLKKIKLEKKIDFPTLIIPARALGEVVRIITSNDSNGEDEKLVLSITKDKTQVIFSYADTEVIARLIEDKYPDFSKIIPDKGENMAIIDREEFYKAIKAASIFARKSANIVKFTFFNNNMTIEANAPEIGENEIKIGIRYKGDKEQIAFNYRFIQDFLSNFDQESLSLEISGPLKPGLFKGEKDNSFLHVIMPVRLQDKE
ncbi:DNA polymerase III subunit beta [Candidatus Beckwithbacteria bacterium CG10_big_fil_rev_8_21_14_0_10_34_10]|uniref:Beta sliding clamp n=1 Tax=Candidatus Beckwithbacteria bacterium CG10_big_fil_rev_8_21_14_0_10_34_10 TaxID=1974495 RepID=A0A2H0WAE6_9BACT|nr:MAG: DNA polymerase III subunit beta [Candidatus Beckwithbacteria bacterium CG10_big_fil_rev_8_21_14_0_10_34_10]